MQFESAWHQTLRVVSFLCKELLLEFLPKIHVCCITNLNDKKTNQSFFVYYPRFMYCVRFYTVWQFEYAYNKRIFGGKSIITYGSCHQEEAFGSKSNLNTRGGHTTLQRYIRNKNVVYVNNVLPLWALQIYSRPSLHKQIFLFDREKCTSIACR